MKKAVPAVVAENHSASRSWCWGLPKCLWHDIEGTRRCVQNYSVPLSLSLILQIHCPSTVLVPMSTTLDSGARHSVRVLKQKCLSAILSSFGYQPPVVALRPAQGMVRPNANKILVLK